MPKRRAFFLIFLCGILLAIDIWVKQATVEHVLPSCGIPIFRDWFGVSFSLEYVKNTGAAWGAFSSMQNLLLWARGGIILALLAYVFYSTASFVRRMALSLVAAGAIGNVLDSLLYGHVVDMFHFRFGTYSFPVFNVADAVIFCGVLCFLAEKMLGKWTESPSSENTNDMSSPA